MKLEVSVKVLAGKEANSTLELIADESDTVASVKERLASLQLIPFPDQELMYNNAVLLDDRQLADYGIKDPGEWSLEFVVKANESTLVSQLKELLKGRDLSCDELGLLYCYKYGASFSQALQLIGRQGERLQDFVRSQKVLQLVNNTVALVREESSLKPFSVADEAEAILKAASSGSMDLKDLCAKFEDKFGTSLSKVAGMKPIDFFNKDKNRFAVLDRRTVSLRSATPWLDRSLPAPQPRCDGAAVKPPPGLADKAPAAKPAAVLSSADNQQYLDLHQDIFGRSAQLQVQQALGEVVTFVRETSFLNVDRVALGGSVSKGTAIAGCIDAAAVFFLPGLHTASQERWLPPLLKSVAGALQESLTQDSCIKSIAVCEDSLRFQTKGLDVAVDVRFAPVFGSYSEAVKAMAAQGAQARLYSAAALVEERVQFIARQPSAVKITARLLKWWRDQQTWSSERSRPSDDVLELTAAYSALQAKPADQKTAIANVMGLFAHFTDLRVVWSNFYSRDDVWPPLLQQRPLLMDPLNPYVNITDPAIFDASELEERARTTHFFW